MRAVHDWVQADSRWTSSFSCRRCGARLDLSKRDVPSDYFRLAVARRILGQRNLVFEDCDEQIAHAIQDA